MKLVSFTASGRNSYGAVVGDGVVDLGRRLGPVRHRAAELLDQEVMDPDLFGLPWGRRPNHRRTPQITLAAHDGGDGDDVVRVDGVPDAEEKPQKEQRHQIAERFGHNTFTGIATPVPSTRRRLASSARPFRHARVFDGIAALTHWIGYPSSS